MDEQNTEITSIELQEPQESQEVINPEPIEKTENIIIPINKEIEMDPLNANYVIEKNVKSNDCLEVGLESIASAHRAGLAAEATASRVGLAADATAQRIGLGADGTAQRMAIAELDAIGRVESEVCDSSRDVVREVHRADNHVSDVVERNADKTQAEVERFGLSELEAIRSSEKYLYAGMSQNAKDVLMFNSGEFQRVKLQAADNTKDLLLQACGNTSEIKMQAEIHARDAALAARDLVHLSDKNTAAIQLEAFRHKEELARQMAECCCEQKALTLETSHATQDLIRKLDEQRVRDELAKTREELIALRLRSTLLPTPVPAITI